MILDILDPTPFFNHPGFPRAVWPDAFPLALQAMVLDASKGRCQKSKRGAMLVAEGFLDMSRNNPAGGRPCDGSAACRASCARTCNHAEERVVLSALRRSVAPLERATVIHVAVDEHGVPRDKAVPGCETCSRLMLAAGVEHVWLWGGAPARWQVWTAEAFHAETLRNLGLHDPLAPVADLRPFEQLLRELDRRELVSR